MRAFTAGNVDYRPLDWGRLVPIYLTGYPERLSYYPAVLTLQESQRKHPEICGLKSRDMDRMIRWGIFPIGEGTLTVVLVPDSEGGLSRRYRTKLGQPLTSKCPMIAEDFRVAEVGGSYEITVRELTRYPELEKAVELLNGQSGRCYISRWDVKRGVPTDFDVMPSVFGRSAVVRIDVRRDYDFGERPVLHKGVHDIDLNQGPSEAIWRFRHARRTGAWYIMQKLLGITQR